MILSSWLVQLAADFAVYLLPSWYGLGAFFCCLLSFIGRLSAVDCCCCCSFAIAVLVIHSLVGARFCCYCRSPAILVMLYRVNLVLSAAASIYWLCW
ncbi:hypothetical protein MAM1_0067d04006 [Mucor ambiguus]|uniref:Uncharacterized protein n=1 Tax=Mucor ambiguus TaxID=91626 RepID=A0A0C9LU77_9FUNG|nr:hypothetical protein MAM1_0067d04006 [Mucor ambiguus]